MKKRILSGFLALVLWVGLAVPAFAAEPDFEIKDGVLMKYSGPGGDVTIPNGVTEIDFGAFGSCTSLTSVTIPDGVTAIGGGAFDGCTSLTSVTIPSSVTEIGESAFQYTPWLESLGEFAVVNHILLAYQGDDHAVTIPNNVTKIGGCAFVGRRNLTSVVIPSSVTKIGWMAFDSCGGLISVTIPSSVTEVEPYVFSSCGNLTSVDIPGSLTEIGQGMFNGCTRLSSVTISNGITKIGYEAFAGCSSLTSVTIPNSVTKIETRAFGNCGGLTNVTIPGSVREIGREAFQGTPWLKGLGDFAVANHILLAYQGGDHAITIPGSITRIGESAFNRCTGLTSVTIPNSVMEIGDCAFVGCTGLTSVTIPNSVTEIGPCTFLDCTGLTSITIPDSVTEIWKDAFDGCTGLTIHGAQGSCAERYAKEHKIPFVANGAPAFTDVPAWCADAVAWAVDNGITTGTGNNKFSPDKSCTHEQILTFLYRAARGGNGTASAADMAAAVSWARGKGMIDAAFNPKAFCTRADAVIYIWRAFDEMGADGHGFTDIPSGDETLSLAVNFAAVSGITNGYANGDGTYSFRPDKVCKRGEIVTFLHRAYVPEASLAANP